MTDLTRFTSGSIAGRQQRLPRPLRDLHRAVLRRFLATGEPPTARWVRQAAADTGPDASAAEELAAADAVHIVNGVVAVAYPFSGTPTAHRVALDGLPAVYAMRAGPLGRRIQRGHPPRPLYRLPPASRPCRLTSDATHGPAR